MKEFDPREDAHLKKRDRKFQRKYDMIVSESGRRFAEIIGNIRRKKEKK